MPRPPAGDARLPRMGQPQPVPPPLQDQGCPPLGAGPLARVPGHPPALLVVATRGDPDRVLGITPTHLYGAAPVPRPPLPVPAARDGVHTFLRTREVTAVTGIHLVRPPPASPDDPRGPRAPSPAPDWELWRDV